jgi:hypothetical protein
VRGKIAMSVPDVPLPPEPPSARSTGTPGLHGCLVVLVVLIGIALLLPGVCSLFFMVAFKGEAGGSLGALWLVSFIVAGCGIALIAWAIRRR